MKQDAMIAGSGFRQSLTLLAAGAMWLTLAVGPANAAIPARGETAPLTRDEVRRGLGERYRGMESRHEQYRLQRRDARRRELSGSRPAVPRDPVPLPGREALP